jgi:hypothetical protein
MHIPKRKQQSTDTETSNFPVGDNSFVSFCTNFKYLGSYLTSAMTDDFEIEHRIQKAKGGFATGIKFLTGKGISIHNRKLLYICTVVNILLFGCETWAIKEPHFTKLEAFHTKHLWKLLGLNMRHVRKHHITNEAGGLPLNRRLPHHQRAYPNATSLISTKYCNYARNTSNSQNYEDRITQRSPNHTRIFGRCSTRLRTLQQI